MSYFDDIEDYRYRSCSYFNRTPQKVHYTEEFFVEGVDGRFAIRKTICGLEFSQSSGRLARRKGKLTCKECLKKIHTNLKESTVNA